MDSHPNEIVSPRKIVYIYLMKDITASLRNSGIFLSIPAWTLIGLMLVMSAAATQAQDRVSPSCAQLGLKQGTQGQNDCVNQGANGLLAQNSISPFSTTKPRLVPELTALQGEERFWDDAKAIGNKEAFEA